MTWTLLLGALGLALVLDGAMPFLSPAAWRRMLERLLAMSDGQLRFMGLTSMLIGVAVLVVFLG